jgi:hypothetical protein
MESERFTPRRQKVNQIEEAKKTSPGNVVNIGDARDKTAPAGEARSRRPRADEMMQEFLGLLKAECDSESFFHTPDRETFAHIRANGHFENWPLGSTGFRTWVAHAFYRMMKMSPDENTMKLLMLEFSGKALFDGREIAVAIRVGEYAGKLYVDLCESQWRAVEVSGSGWSVVSDPPVRFRRSAAMHALPNPEEGGDVTELLNFLNLATRDDKLLALTWIVAVFLAHGRIRFLRFTEPPGVGKQAPPRCSVA